MFLQPREYFPITRQLADPFDSTTYYLHAEIRNENENTVIDTVNLTDEGNQLFVLRYQLPPDVSGQGFWISIRTRVYTDAGYTTLSENHEQMLNTYLVFDRMRSMGGGGGYGGADVDYKKIQRMLDATAAALTKAFPDVDISSVLKAIKALPEPADVKPLMVAIEKLPKEKADFTPLAKELVKKIDIAEENIRVEIKNKKIPEPEKFNYTTILDALHALDRRLAAAKGLEQYISVVQELAKTAPGLAGEVEKAVKLLQTIEGASKDFLYLMQKNGRPATTTKSHSFDSLFPAKETA